MIARDGRTQPRPRYHIRRPAEAGYYDHGRGRYFQVHNLFDHDPTPSPQTNTGLDANPMLYDLAASIALLLISSEYPPCASRFIPGGVFFA